MRRFYLGRRFTVPWWWVIGALWVGVLGIDPLFRLYDDYLRHRPWVAATMQIQPAQEGKPRIIYDVTAPSLVSGEWNAWVESESGMRLCNGGRGIGHYSPANSGPRSWEWADWLGRDCYEPVIPFKVCVQYAVETPRGARGQFGPFCSDSYVREDLEQ